MNKSLVFAVLLAAFAAAEVRAEVVVHLDISEVNDNPKLAEWGKNAKELIEQWYQRTVNLLPVRGCKVPQEIWLTIRKKENGIAAAAGSSISVSSGWIDKHPGDLGCVYHELVHVVQNYRGKGPAGWITEGIADYLRWAIYEGKPLEWFPVRDKLQGYKDGYRITGGFFLWMESSQWPGIVKKINSAVKKGLYKDESFFEQETGKTIDELWAEYVKDRKKEGENKSSST